MKGSTIEPNELQMATRMAVRGTKREPKWCQAATRMAPKPIQNDPGTSNWASPAKLKFWDSFWMRLGAAQGSTLVPKSVKAPWKGCQTVCPKNDAEKVSQKRISLRTQKKSKTYF